MRVYLGASLTALVLAASGWRMQVHRECYARHARSRLRMEDLNSLRIIALGGAARGTLPMKDGAFDPYDLLRTGDLDAEPSTVFRSYRFGVGPTEEEVQRGDYTNFPWARYRGDPRILGLRFPLLWDKKPDEDGLSVVAFSDGSAEILDREQLGWALEDAADGR